MGQVSTKLTHGFTRQFQAMCIVHETIQDGVSQGVITDAGIPLGGRQLADDTRRGRAVAIIHDFHQVMPMRGF